MNSKKFWSWESYLQTILSVIFVFIVIAGIIIGWNFDGFLTAVFGGILSATIGVLIVGINMVIIHISDEISDIKNIIANMNTSAIETMGTALSKVADEKKQQEYNQELLKNGGWKCTQCGKVNPTYTGTCSCGKSKY